MLCLDLKKLGNVGEVPFKQSECLRESQLVGNHRRRRQNTHLSEGLKYKS